MLSNIKKKKMLYFYFGQKRLKKKNLKKTKKNKNRAVMYLYIVGHSNDLFIIVCLKYIYLK